MRDNEQETVLFTACADVLAAAEKKLLGCEICSGEAVIPFKVLLDEVMPFSGVHTDYVMEHELACYFCGGIITEETLVDWKITCRSNSSAWSYECE